MAAPSPGQVWQATSPCNPVQSVTVLTVGSSNEVPPGPFVQVQASQVTSRGINLSFTVLWRLNQFTVEYAQSS